MSVLRAQHQRNRLQRYPYFEKIFKFLHEDPIKKKNRHLLKTPKKISNCDQKIKNHGFIAIHQSIN